MADSQEKLSEQIKINNIGGQIFASHSDAYDDLMARAVVKGASKKVTDEFLALMEKEQAEMKLATSSKNESSNALEQKVPDTEAKRSFLDAAQLPNNQEQPLQHLAVTERLARANEAFAEANLQDVAIAKKNLEGIQKTLIDTAQYTGMTPDLLKQASEKAYIDVGERLYEKMRAAYKKDNALTYEVGNFSQAPDKNMVNADIGANASEIGFGADVHHGFDAKALGLTLAEINVGATANNDASAGAHAGARAVKLINSDAEQNWFLAGAANLSASNLQQNSKLGGDVTGLVVHTHELMGRPTSEIAGVAVDVPTGKTTVVGSVSQTLNADTDHATTARAVGTYGVDSSSGGFSLEAYQQTGIKNLTARINVGVADVGGDNQPSAGVGFSYGL